MRTRQLYASITASISGTVYFDIPDKTRIRQIEFCCTPSGVGSNQDYVEVECCLSSTCQTAVSDAQGILAGASFANSGTGAPASLSVVSPNVIVPCNFPVIKGDRIYLNATESGTSTWRVRAIVTFD